MKKNYIDLLENIYALAQTGIRYTKSPFDMERYQKLLNIATQEYSEFTGLETEVLKERFRNDLGYATPKVGVNGILFDDNGRLLVEHRSDDFLWGLPGGWVDIGEDPETAMKREFWEEARLIVEPVEIIKFFAVPAGQFQQPHSSVVVLYLCKYVSGNIETSIESLEIKFVDPAEITTWHKNHGEYVKEALLHRKKALSQV
ncbi:NUDIX hydrolase N-terminal domain-containing protein [Mucilaginibacter sp. NFR10]|uniref:NUDIX hydrolase N-terminal domain-containing protein n=1 Tax=Mucilaginibacter sp. NFR10 TaxID=1566292 RepID=UPI0008715C2D|nr:NUDIX hydrolase N-terminal domain-containing protein [Mucilaginibacter sp. NFR10]SCW40715.1 ADP-ribose pyrophosphatase YjhB, NUDIX family [Mucilaginibacter sp. NFR10]